MIAVGIITGDQGEWTVPVDAETKFPVIDVSEEPRDGDPTAFRASASCVAP